MIGLTGGGEISRDEEVQGVGKYGDMLTVLSSEELSSDPDEGEDAESLDAAFCLGALTGGLSAANLGTWLTSRRLSRE